MAVSALGDVGGTVLLDRPRRLRVALAVCCGRTHHGHRRLSLTADRGRTMPGDLPTAPAPRVGRGCDWGRAGQFGQSSHSRDDRATTHASTLSPTLHSNIEPR